MKGSRRPLARLLPLLGVLIGASPGLGCGPASPEPAKTVSAQARALLPDVRLAKDRPPVVLVAREGDPSGAIAVAVTTSYAQADPEIAVGLAGVVEGRLASRGLGSVVTPSWTGYRAALLVATAAEAEAATQALRDALNAPIADSDLGFAKKKLAALAARPLTDGALWRWARCVGSPYALPPRAGKSGDDLDVAQLERWRAATSGLGRVALAVVAPAKLAETVASTVARLPPWNVGAPPPAAAAPVGPGIDVDVYETADALPTARALAVVHATIDVGSGSDAVTTAEALGDPHGPLASRLANLELPFRMREVTGTADPRGGCVGIVLEASSVSAGTTELAPRVADAVALVHVEAKQHLTEGGNGLDGRTLARRAGDAREAAERAAWWALADAWNGQSANAAKNAPSAMRGSVALGLPLRRGAPSSPESTASSPARDALATAVQRAALAWQKPVADGRARVEPGQGETWVLLASPCGTESETDTDAGLTALFTGAAAELARSSPEAHVEPWITADGAGLLVHGPALLGETAAGHARRLADVVARSFASDAILPSSIGVARAWFIRHDAQSDGPALGLLANVLAPGHPSWVVPSGQTDALARVADAAVLARAQALRAGPLRVAVLANVDAAQSEAALRAVDRWIDRRGEGARACRSGSAASAVRAGTYGLESRPGSTPEAYLAFPIAHDDVNERAAATLLAAALDGDGGLLDKALRGPGLARSWSARVVGWPRAPALVVRLVATQANLDGAVMQTRALVDRLWRGGLTPADHERATAITAHESVVSALDPRARVVATWRGEPVATSAQPLPGARPGFEETRAFAAKRLGEDTMAIVASRPPFVRPAPAASSAAASKPAP